MKQLLHIFIGIILFGLSACQQETTYPLAMQQAEALMNTRPDSALHLLQGMADSISTLSEEPQMYYHLLTIQAKDKQYITHTSDSLINRIVSFYEDYDDNDRLMIAYFYQGSTYRDMNDAPRALKAFHQAIDAGKETENFTLLGQTYGQMGTLLSKHALYDGALEVYRKTLYLYQEANENQRIPLVYRNIARMYDAKGEKDSAILFYEKGHQIARENKDEKIIQNITSELGCIYYLQGYLEKAKLILYPLATAASPKSNAILYLGLSYDALNQKDSARYFISQILDCNNIGIQNAAHKYLFKLENEIGNKNKAIFHHKQHLILQDSIQAMKHTDELKERHLTYNYEHLKKAYEKLKTESKNYQQHSIAYWILVITFASIRAIVYFWKKKKNTLSSKNSVTYSIFSGEKIFLLFQKAGRNEHTVSESDWIELHKLLEKKLPDFTKELSYLTQSFKLSQQETRICCLLKLGFINQAISNILRVSKSAVSRSQSRMYRKLTGEKECASKMRLFIEEL